MISVTAPGFSMTGRRNGAPLFYAGWVGFAVFGTVAWLEGHAAVSYSALHIGVAAAICTWYTLTTGKAAPAVGLILGLLFLAQMGLFFVSDLTTTDDHHSLTTTLEDAFGLLTAMSIVAGSVLGLRRR
jgi:hypothetical protein